MNTAKGWNRLAPIGAALLAIGFAAMPASAADKTGEAPQRLLECDDTLKTDFKPDDRTTVLLVRQFRKGDAFPSKTLEQFVYPRRSATFDADLCLVKLMVGPGTPGPADALSTSPGVAIDVWLPTKDKWNRRFHAVGGAGWSGSEEAMLDRISGWSGTIDTRSAPRVAAEDGSVTATENSGHGGIMNGSFLMLPDGSVNLKGMDDWAYRGLYEQAVKAKALARAYYGSAPTRSYFDGASGGGWQAFHVAQKLPEQYDGIVAGVPAVDWLERSIGALYPSLVILRELDGKPMSPDQLALVSNAAIAACDVVGGQHLGFIIDPAACRYDPSRDAAVLCAAEGGGNRSPVCLTRRQAVAINKIWYGLTEDGSVPDPAVDNGWKGPASGVRRSYGHPRGTKLVEIAQLSGNSSGADFLAVLLGNPALGSRDFRNATGKGKDAWRDFTYAQLAGAFDRAMEMQPQWKVSATNPDLSAFKARGGKFIAVLHLNDERIAPNGAIHYYDKVAQGMGGVPATQTFFRLFVAPGVAHGSYNGTSNAAASVPVQARHQMTRALIDWVEKGAAPDNIVFNSFALSGDDFAGGATNFPATREVSLPLCAYPSKLYFVSGDIFQERSYRCR